MAASGLLLAALAYPAVAPEEFDSFPLSNYPMFAHERSRVTTFSVAVLIDDVGEEHRLDLRAVGGTDQPVQAAMTVRQAIRTDQAAELCAEIAERVNRIGTVQVASVRYDAPAWFGGDEQPVSRTVHAECPAAGEGT